MPCNARDTPEQVVLDALRACAAEHNYPGGDLDLVTPERAAPVVVEALRKAGLLPDARDIPGEITE